MWQDLYPIGFFIFVAFYDFFSPSYLLGLEKLYFYFHSIFIMNLNQNIVSSP